MTTFTGYTLHQRIHRSTAHVVYRGKRAWDGLPVVLKCPAARFPSPRDVARLHREYAALTRLNGHGAPLVVTLENQEQGLFLATVDVDGRPLSSLLQRGPLEILAFLETALACCDALTHVHTAGLVHKNLTPSNILITPTGEARIIDFACVGDLTTVSEVGEPPLLEGTPAYMAPEQTGRVNRPVDHRCDYYGLGATFYELLCARPPFGAEDTLDLVLAHVSRPPSPPHVRNPRVPPVLSAIVLKLLNKEPEERYQSLRGLRADLEICADALMREGSVPYDLEIGGRDRSDVFRLSQRLYGRTAEKAALAAGLERAIGGRTELILVRGPSGVGKTALIREMFRPVSGRRGAFVSGKFEEFRRNVPYGAVIEAFSQYIRGLLSGSEQDLELVRGRITRALGSQGGVLTTVMPELEIVIGPQAPVPVLPTVETENRFTRAFRALIGAVVGPSQPLVLFLDDLQWADRSTLHLLQQILTSRDQRHVLIIGAYRDDGVDTNHPLAFLLDRLRAAGIAVTEIALTPLGQADVTALIRDSLRCTEAEAAPLARLCLDKTRGNPFFLTRFLTSLNEAGHIRFDNRAEAWTWQIEDIAALDITDNVVDLMVEKVERLSPSCQRVLQRAACIGGSFDLDTLSRINDVDPRETLSQLWEALTEGLAIPMGEAYHQFRHSEEEDTRNHSGPSAALEPLADTPPERVRFRFLHDRVHQAVYSMITEQERGLRHLNIGRLLLDSATADELNDRLFDILDQLNRGRAHLGDTDLRPRIATLNLQACHKARASAAHDSALAYAYEGVLTLGPDGWTDHRALTLDLHNEAAETAYMLGDFTMMRRLTGEIERHARTAVEKAMALQLTVIGLTRGNDYAAAIDAGLKALDDLGQPLRLRRLALGSLRTRLRTTFLASRLEKTVGLLGRDFDPRGEASMRILIAIFTALSLSRVSLLPAAIERIMGVASTSARPLYIAFAYAAYGLMASAGGRTDTAYRCGARAIEIAADYPDSDLRARIAFVAIFTTAHWRDPLRTIRDRLMDIYTAAVETGDLETTTYVISAYLETGLQSGVDLTTIERNVAFARETARRHNNHWGEPFIDCVAQVLDNLTRPTEAPERLIGDSFNEETTAPRLLAQHDTLMLTRAQTLKLFLALIFGRFTEAQRILHHLEQNLALLPATFAGASVLFYGAVVHARSPSTGNLQRRLSRLRRSLKMLRRWAAQGPANTLHRQQLLIAEEARLTSHTLRAAEFYDQAIKTAHESGFTHEEALINEFAADFHEQRGRPMIASAYRRQAHYRYRLWGATAKAALMEEEWPELSDVNDLSIGGIRDGAPSDAHGFDLAAIMKATQTISGEIQRPKLLENLLRITMGTAGAHRGLLFLRGEEGWTIEAEGETSADRFTLHRARVTLREEAAAPSEDGEASEGGATSEDDGAHSAASSSPAPAFSRSIFNYVARAREAVVLDDAPEAGPFTADPYVMRRRPRSVLCLPLFQQADLKGMLYLENNLATGAFTAERLEVLNLLAAQVVISLDNAMLYDNLAELNRSLERQVAERTREATEKSRLLEATLDSMSDGLVAYDANERLLVWNDRAVSVFRVPGELRRRGTPYRSVVDAALASGALSPRLADIVRERLAEGTPPFPEKPSSEIELADGRYLQVRRTPTPDGGQVQIFLDVTEERRRERELVAARQAAERTLAELQETQENLIQAEKMASLGQLVAGVAHEINTPVGITLTAASFLRERAEELHTAVNGPGIRKSQLNQFVDQSLETTTLMVANIQRAADLIHSFKQVAVDQTSGERRLFNVAAYIDEVLRSFGPMLRRTSHTVTVDCPADLDIESYPGALSQVLTNFVMNAVTHAFDEGQSGAMHIAVRPLNDGGNEDEEGNGDENGDGDEIELTFADNGRGIPADQHSRVFDPFFTTRRGQGGSGLGLNIVFNLVNSALGGTVTLTSRTTEDATEDAPSGTTFTLRLPRVAPRMRLLPAPR